MRFSFGFKPALLLVLAMALTPLLMPATASAEPTTIYADLGRCRTNVDNYQVQLQSGNQRAPQSAFPESVTILFEDGSSTVATPLMGASFGTIYYYSYDLRDVAVIGATAEFDTELYPNYRFTVTARPEPCFPAPEPVTYSVSGNITQQGNMKPVADLDVCLGEAELCTTTGADGSFVIAGVEDGTYTLYTDGDNWKAQYTTVTVEGGDVTVDVVQQKGGGNGK